MIKGRPCGLFLVSLMTALFMYKQDTKEMKYITNFPRCLLEMGYSDLNALRIMNY